MKILMKNKKHKVIKVFMIKMNFMLFRKKRMKKILLKKKEEPSEKNINWNMKEN
jgi:hypothetical protein